MKLFRRYGRFSIFQDGGRPPCCIFKNSKFYLPVPFGGPICVIMPNFMAAVRHLGILKVGPIFVNISKSQISCPSAKPLRKYRRFSIFRRWRRSPSCCSLVWTAHEEYLEVVVIVQNLVGIDAVVSIICKFEYFVR